MPGWYVHMEAAHDSASRLRNGSRAGGLPDQHRGGAADRRALPHAGATTSRSARSGPDLFYLLPDFKNTTGAGDPPGRPVGARCLGGRRRAVRQQVGEVDRPDLDEQRPARLAAHRRPVDPARPGARRADLRDHLGVQGPARARWATGSASSPPASRRVRRRRVLLVATCSTTGAPTSSPSSCSSRPRTPSPPRRRDDERQDAEARHRVRGRLDVALRHRRHRPPVHQRQVRRARTATTGSATISSRTTWTRENYGARHPGPLFGEIRHVAPCTSGSRSGTATTRRTTAATTRPAYDYWTGFPAYDNGDGPTATANRHDLLRPRHRAAAGPPGRGAARRDAGRVRRGRPAHPPPGPAVLRERPGDRPAGRPPNDDALARCGRSSTATSRWPAATRSACACPPPPASSPTTRSRRRQAAAAPGSTTTRPAAPTSTTTTRSPCSTCSSRSSRGRSTSRRSSRGSSTVLPGLIVDITTFPAREVVYWAVIVPAWNLYLLARRALVMSGVRDAQAGRDQHRPDHARAEGTYDIASALDDPFGLPTAPPPITEPSGRLHATDAPGLDHAYPRGIVRDLPSAIGRARPRRRARAHLAAAVRRRTPRATCSSRREWVAPWRYPLTNQAGNGSPQEGAGTHVGPYVVGRQSTVLLSALAGRRRRTGRPREGRDTRRHRAAS